MEAAGSEGAAMAAVSKCTTYIRKPYAQNMKIMTAQIHENLPTFGLVLLGVLFMTIKYASG